MTAQTLDGKATTKTIKEELAQRVSRLLEAGHERPGLATVLVGDDPGSAAYVRGKHRDSERVGLNSIQKHLPADATQADVEALVDELNQDTACTGYIVQLPRTIFPAIFICVAKRWQPSRCNASGRGITSHNHNQNTAMHKSLHADHTKIITS